MCLFVCGPRERVPQRWQSSAATAKGSDVWFQLLLHNSYRKTITKVLICGLMNYYIIVIIWEACSYVTCTVSVTEIWEERTRNLCCVVQGNGLIRLRPILCLQMENDAGPAQTQPKTELWTLYELVLLGLANEQQWFDFTIIEIWTNHTRRDESTREKGKASGNEWPVTVFFDWLENITGCRMPDGYILI